MATIFLHCIVCGEELDLDRARLTYKTCPEHGEAEARKVKHLIAPLNKSNYYYIPNPELLKQLNPKRT